MHMCVGVYTTLYRGQTTTLWSCVSLSTFSGVPGIELRSPDSTDSIFTPGVSHWIPLPFLLPDHEVNCWALSCVPATVCHHLPEASGWLNFAKL